MSTGLELSATSETTGWGFKRVICGVDDTPESFECVPQAVALADPEAAVEAVAVVDRGLAMHAGIHADDVERDLRKCAERALRRVRAAYPRATAGILRGAEASTLLEEARGAGSDLVAVGSHDASRALGIALGSVATSVIHRAPCSVLIARTDAAHPFPDGILVATDGSDDAGRAVAVAARIACRHGSRVALLQVGDSHGARSVAEDAMRVVEMTGNEPSIEVRQGSTAHEIERFASACRASLVVVGSRGLGGVRALGSVSERVAHRAPCSVLIVRGEPASDAGEGAR